MTSDQLDAYKKAAKPGDCFNYYLETGEKHATPYWVHGVFEKGVTFSIRKTARDHFCFMDWPWLLKYNIIHKEL